MEKGIDERAIVPVGPPACQRVFYIIALAAIVCFILVAGAGFFVPLVVGAFFAMLLVPLAAWIERRVRNRLAGAALPVVAMIAVLLVITALAFGQIASIAGSLEDADERIKGLIDQTDRTLRWHLNLDEPVFEGMNGERIVEWIREYSGDLLRLMGGFAGSVFGAVIVPVFTLFFLYYRNHLIEFLVRVLRHAPHALVERRAEEARVVAQSYLLGLMKVVGILAVLNSTALWLIGVEHAVFFGVFAAVLNVVPYLGPILGSVLPTLFVLLTEDSLHYPLAIVGAFALIQMLESNLLTPNIIGRNVRLNPLAAFTGLLAGGLIWGIIGMVIAIPALSIAMQLFRLSPRTAPYAFLLGVPLRSGQGGPG
ncbi:MAG: AI-2E family transporter [Opitutales bacterium]|nr:AI-2E family transporter [Opitutales bacterium]